MRIIISLLLSLMVFSECATIARAFTRVVVIGDSVGLGYGLKEEESFVRLLTQKFREKYTDFRTINLSKGGRTSSDAVRDIESLLNFSGRPEICILEVGGNEYLAKVPAAQTASHLRSICSFIKHRYPKAILVIIGLGYMSEKEIAYMAPAKEFGAICVTDFRWEDAAVKDLRQADGIHPTKLAQEEIATKVFSALPKLPLTSLADNAKRP